MHVFGVLCPEKVSLAKEHACKNSSDEACLPWLGPEAR